MKRRDFLKAAIAAIAVPTTAIAVPETIEQIQKRVCKAQPLRCEKTILTGELGRVESVRFIETPVRKNGMITDESDLGWQHEQRIAWKSWNEAKVLNKAWFQHIKVYG